MKKAGICAGILTVLTVAYALYALWMTWGDAEHSEKFRLWPAGAKRRRQVYHAKNDYRYFEAHFRQHRV